MKLVFYVLIIIVLILSLISAARIEKFMTGDKPSIPIIKKAQCVNNIFTIIWDKPLSTDPLSSYFIMIKKQSPNSTDGLYLNVSTQTDCLTCTYTINNINLELKSTYYASVIAINKNGASMPAVAFVFTPTMDPSQPTITPTISSSDSQSLSSGSVPTNTPTNAPTMTPATVDASSYNTPTPSACPTESTLFLDDRIKKSQADRKLYLDSQLQAMTSKANGIYEINKNDLTYPDTYLTDIKKSIKTLNDQVTKDLQEYRLNVHFSSVK